MSNSGQSSSRRTEDERLDLTHAEVSETQSGISSDLSAASARKPDTKVASKPRIFSGQSKPSHDGLNLGELVANRYEIRESLGKGGFGAVYRAHDRELNRVVAIKRSNGLRSFVAGQIRNEAQSVASLNHPNIIAIYDLITVTDDDLLIVMECLAGSPLSQRLQQPRISV